MEYHPVGYGRWVRARVVVQACCLILFLYLAVGTRQPIGIALPPDLFFRLDPLAQVAASLASRTLAPFFFWAVPLVLATLLLGRFFCGWICPMGTTLDLFRLRRVNPPRGRRERSLRSLKYSLLAALLVAALAGSTVLIPLDPLTLLARTFSIYLYPAFNAAVTGLVYASYDRGILPDLMVWIDGDLRGSLLPAIQPYYRLSWLFLLLFGAVVGLNLLAHRFWCRYICPLGGLLALLGRWSPLGRHNKAGCSACAKCVASCRVGTVEPKGFASDTGECILCGDCASICPDRAISFGGLASPGGYDPSRRQLLGVAGLTALGVAGFRADTSQREVDPFLVRPPGAQGPQFLQKCLRCGECMKVCPSSGLQPATFQAGMEGVWTPMLVSRIGSCNYDCTACGEVCPTAAIERLELETKRHMVIGAAYIDPKRCIPWTDGKPCIVCQELCPVSPKAILLDSAEVFDEEGRPSTVQRPRMVRSRCIGCGICEQHCPLPGEAAIRVYNAAAPLA